MVRQELPEPNACGHCVRPVNMVYMLTGSSDLKQEARLLVAEWFTKIIYHKTMSHGGWKKYKDTMKKAGFR